MVDTWVLQNADWLQVVLFFGLLAILAPAERVAARRPQDMDRRRRWPANYGLTALNLGVMGLLPVTFFGTAVWARQHEMGLLNQSGVPAAGLILGTLLLRGFISFFTHYLAHRVPLLWRVHRVHHLDPELDVSTTVRFHPLEFLVNLVLGAPLVVAFGLTPWVLLAYEVLDAGVTLFSHANVRVPAWIERVVRFIVVTPDLHRVHHSAWRPETNSNYGAVFPVWDLVFGTFRTRTRESHETMRLGLDEVRDERVSRLAWLLGSPMRRQL